MKKAIILLMLLSLFILLSCSSNVENKLPGAFCIGDRHYDTLQEAIDSLSLSKSATREITTTVIKVNRDVTDSGAVFSNASTSIIVDLNNCKYTIANSESGIVIESGSELVEISGGRIAVGSGNTFKNLLEIRSTASLSDVSIDLTNKDLNVCEISNGDLTISGETSIKTDSSDYVFRITNSSSVEIVSDNSEIQGRIVLSPDSLLRLNSGCSNINTLKGPDWYSSIDDQETFVAIAEGEVLFFSVFHIIEQNTCYEEKEYSPEGLFQARYIYYLDSSGHITEARYFDDQNVLYSIEHTEYDLEGRCAKKYYNNDNDVVESYLTYAYNGNNEVLMTYFDANGVKLKSTRVETSANGRITREYDENDILQKVEERNSEGNPVRSFYYYQNGVIRMKKEYYSDYPDLRAKTIRYYANDGTLTKTEQYDTQGNLI